MNRAGWVVIAALSACRSRSSPPPPKDAVVAIDAAAMPIDAPRPVVPPIRITPAAPWSNAVVKGTASPSCMPHADTIWIARFDDVGQLQLCLREQGDLRCWRVDLTTGRYVAVIGENRVMPDPVGVGLGTERVVTSRARDPVAVSSRWAADALEVCRERACNTYRLRMPVGGYPNEPELATNAAATIAVVALDAPVGNTPTDERRFALLDLAAHGIVSTWAMPRRRRGAQLSSFIGSTLAIEDCDDAGECLWDLVDPKTGARIAAVGGAQPLGDGGTVVELGDTTFAAISRSTLVFQSTDGAVTARMPLGHTRSYRVLRAGDDLVLVGLDGRIVFVDPTTRKVVRTIVPPRC